MLVLAAAALLALAVSAQICTSPSVRREWRELSDGQRQAYLAAVAALKERPPGSADQPQFWNLDQFAEAHWDNMQHAHGVPAFLPWHRRFMDHFEKALQTIDASVNVPFWDWSLDSQQPQSSPIFSSQYFGGNGRDSDNCVVDGLAANWSVVLPPQVAAPCLRRCIQWAPFYSPEAINFLIATSQSYGEFRPGLENGPHPILHELIGGRCGPMSNMASPNDPLFFLHHAMIDRIWWRWQEACASYRTDYADGDARPSDVLAAWNEPVSNLFSTTDNGLCYTYSPSVSDSGLQPDCPADQPQPNSTATATATSSSVLASPTPTLSPHAFWLHEAIYKLLPNISPANLTVSEAAGAAEEADPIDPNQVDPIQEVSTKEEADQVDPIDATLHRRDSANSKTASSRTSLRIPVYHRMPYHKVAAPSERDTTDLFHLRHPHALSARTISGMHLDEAHVRRLEVQIKHLIDDYNSRSNYVSVAALIYYNRYRKTWVSPLVGNYTLS